MELKKKLELLEETVDAEPGSITPDLLLDENEWWDSLAKLSLTVMLDEEFGKKITTDDFRKMVKVQDLLNWMEHE